MLSMSIMTVLLLQLINLWKRLTGKREGVSCLQESYVLNRADDAT